MTTTYTHEKAFLVLMRGEEIPQDWRDKLAKAKVLDLAGHGISDISALKHCPNLRAVSLDNNQISDISALKHCPELQQVWLDGNPVDQASLAEVRLVWPQTTLHM